MKTFEKIIKDKDWERFCEEVPNEYIFKNMDSVDWSDFERWVQKNKSEKFYTKFKNIIQKGKKKQHKEKIKSEIENLQKEKNELVKSQRFEEAATYRDKIKAFTAKYGIYPEIFDNTLNTSDKMKCANCNRLLEGKEYFALESKRKGKSEKQSILHELSLCLKCTEHFNMSFMINGREHQIKLH